MFRTAVQEYQASIRKGDVDEARSRLRAIEARYMGDDSAFEVNRQAKKEKLSERQVLTESIFDDVLGQIDKDLGR